MPLAAHCRSLMLGFVLLMAVPAVAAPVDREGKLRSSGEIERELRDIGAARIIVEFSEPEAFSDAALASGRLGAALRREQDRLLAVARTLDDATASSDVRLMAIEPLFALQATEAEIARLLADPAVRSIHYDQRHDLLAGDRSMNLIGMPPVWQHGGLGQGQILAIVDSGVDGTHPFLVPRVLTGACFGSRMKLAKGVYSHPTCPGGGNQAFGPDAGRPCLAPGCYHGTHVAGIAAGSNPSGGKPGRGVAPEAGIIAVNVFSEYTVPGVGTGITTFDSDLIRALEWIYSIRHDFGPAKFAAVNMSLGGTPYSAEKCDGSLVRPIISTLRTAGIATVIASGNDGFRYKVSSPACISKAVTVGATDIRGRIAGFSNMGVYVDVMAPGVNVLSSVPGGYAVLSGTSMAAPHVAGAFAALRSLYPGTSVQTLTKQLAKTGILVTDDRPQGYYTKPLIQVDRVRRNLASDLLADVRSDEPPVLSVMAVPAAE
jgi:subtilisin family serine protease